MCWCGDVPCGARTILCTADLVGMLCRCNCVLHCTGCSGYGADKFCLFASCKCGALLCGIVCCLYGGRVWVGVCIK